MIKIEFYRIFIGVVFICSFGCMVGKVKFYKLFGVESLILKLFLCGCLIVWNCIVVIFVFFIFSILFLYVEYVFFEYCSFLRFFIYFSMLGWNGFKLGSW